MYMVQCICMYICNGDIITLHFIYVGTPFHDNVHYITVSSTQWMIQLIFSALYNFQHPSSPGNEGVMIRVLSRFQALKAKAY